MPIAKLNDKRNEAHKLFARIKIQIIVCIDVKLFLRIVIVNEEIHILEKKFRLEMAD